MYVLTNNKIIQSISISAMPVETSVIISEAANTWPGKISNVYFYKLDFKAILFTQFISTSSYYFGTLILKLSRIFQLMQTTKHEEKISSILGWSNQTHIAPMEGLERGSLQLTLVDPHWQTRTHEKQQPN